MSISFQGSTLLIDGKPIQQPWTVLDAIEHADKIFVLFDPDSYLLNSSYKILRRQGAPVIRNLIAIDKNGRKLWDGELPDTSDYYYRICSAMPLVVNSFSSFRCEIDTYSGKIKSREFVK